MVIIVEYKYHSKYVFHLWVHLHTQWMEPDLQWTQVQRAHQKNLAYTVWLQSGHSVSGSKDQFYCRIQVLTGATQNTQEARLHSFLELSSHNTGYMLNVDSE